MASIDRVRVTVRRLACTKGLGWVALSASLAFAGLFLGCSRSVGTSHDGVPTRIISLAPSITETLFALGCGPRVVGVTRYCTYPPEAQRLPKVGGYLDVSYEQVLALRPDLVMVMREQTTVTTFLKENHVRYMTIDDQDVQAMCASIRAMGQTCGVALRADSIVREIERALVPGDPAAYCPSVLLCIGRMGMGTGAIAQAYVAGRGTFYDELIRAAGGRNVVTRGPVAYPVLSTEGIMRLAPEVIIDVVPTMSGLTEAQIRGDWRQLDVVPAVRSGDVYCLTGDYVTIPGPRVLLLLRDIRHAIETCSSRRERVTTSSSSGRPFTSKAADLAAEMHEVKQCYHAHVEARRGIEE